MRKNVAPRKWLPRKYAVPLGQLLLSWREEARLEPLEVAYELKVSPSSLRQWETGTVIPNYQSMGKLLRFYNRVLEEPFQSYYQDPGLYRKELLRVQKKFGRWLKKRQDLMGITSEELAQQLFVSKRTVAKWRQGDNWPDKAILPELYRILGSEFPLREKMS